METIYPYAHIIHLILAIMFLGYVFTDLAVISALKGKFDKENQQKINQSLGKRSFKIFPLTLLFLILTGGMMMTKYINSTAGFAETNLQKILLFKIALVTIIAIGVGSTSTRSSQVAQKATLCSTISINWSLFWVSSLS